MKNSWKVAMWEFKKNVTNKSFIISIFLTPILIFLFAFIPNLLSNTNSAEPNVVGSDGAAPVETTLTVYALDELGLVDDVKHRLVESQSEIDFVAFEGTESEVQSLVQGQENLGYVALNQSLLESKQFNFYVGGEKELQLYELYGALVDAIDTKLLRDAGVSEDTIQFMTSAYSYQEIPLTPANLDFLNKLIPGVVAGVILFGIIMTGMMQFQSAVQEKRDKVSEILLSSITPNDLMQGKIIGYFLLGMLQIGVWLVFGISAASIYFELPIISYLLNAQFLLLIAYAIGGYLLFSAIFVALGATMDDLNTSGNFQGIILMLPFLPFLLISPVISDPNGMIALVGSYIPITSPAIMLLRLSILDQLPAIEIILSLAFLVIGIWLMMKIAGKIFRTGIMMYGKNATPAEIWKWIRQ